MDNTNLPVDILQIIFSHSNILLLLCKNVEKLYIKIESKKRILNIDFKKYINLQILILQHNKNISDIGLQYLTNVRHLD